jgi:hypothetical protein
MSKYHSKKITIDGITFDSKKEANRYRELKLLERAGKVKDISLQHKFELQPSFKKNGKTIRAITYIADFVYFDLERMVNVVEDVKGYKKGPAYALFSVKRKLMLQVYGIRVQEVG